MLETGDSFYVNRLSGKLGGDGLFKFATLQEGRWVAEPDLERRLQAWFDREAKLGYAIDNVGVGASFEFDEG